MPKGVEFSGGTIVIVKFDAAAQHRARARRAERTIPGSGANAIVQQYGEPAARQVMIRVHTAGAESGGSLSASAEAVTSALQQAKPRQRSSVVGREIVGPTVGEELQTRGILATIFALGGILRLHRLPVPIQLRGRRRRGDDPRPAHHAGVPGVLPLRPEPERDRGDADDHRLLDERHDRHLRPRAREHALDAARQSGQHRQRRRSTRCSIGP